MGATFTSLPPTLILSPLVCFSKKRLFEEIARCGMGKSGMALKDITRALNLRESRGSTVIAEGVALPHLRSTVIDESFAVLSILEDPVPFGLIDSEPSSVDVALTFFFSSRDPVDRGEAMLERLSHLLGDPELVKALRRTRHDPGKLAEILAVIDQRMQDGAAGAPHE